MIHFPSESSLKLITQCVKCDRVWCYFVPVEFTCYKFDPKIYNTTYLQIIHGIYMQPFQSVVATEVFVLGPIFLSRKLRTV